LSFYQAQVNLPGRSQSRAQISLSDSGKSDTVDFAGCPPAQAFSHVLGNSFTFPIQVGGQVDHFSRSGCLPQRFEFLAFAANQVEGRGKILQVNVQVVNRHLQNVAAGSSYGKAGAEHTFDGIGFFA
jgi:hypothetical protein